MDVSWQVAPTMMNLYLNVQSLKWRNGKHGGQRYRSSISRTMTNDSSQSLFVLRERDDSSEDNDRSFWDIRNVLLKRTSTYQNWSWRSLYCRLSRPTAPTRVHDRWVYSGCDCRNYPPRACETSTRRKMFSISPSHSLPESG